MSYTAETFLARIHDDVIRDMSESNILASLTAAQALIESNKGNSGLTVQCNNLFGIKGEYNGQYGLFWTTEYYNGIKTRVQAKFRKYPDWFTSISDHSRFLTSGKRYKNVVVGKYNNYNDDENHADAIFEVGNGTAISNRQNALQVMKNGDLRIQGDIYLQDGTSLEDYIRSIVG